MDGEDEWNHLVHIGEGPEHPHTHRAHRDYDEGQRSRLTWEKGKLNMVSFAVTSPKRRAIKVFIYF